MGILFNTSFSFTTLITKHLFILTPYIHLVIAVALWEMYKLRVSLTSILVVAVMFCSLVYTYLDKCLMRYQQLQWESRENEACDITAVTNWLLEHKLYHAVFFDRDVNNGARFLSSFKLRGDYDTRLVQAALADAGSDAAFVIRNPDNNKSRYGQVKSAASEMQKKIVVLKDFFSRSGKIKIRVFTLQ
jgi:hypothetical protein